MEWISVKEKLPEVNVKVLCFDTCKIYIACLPDEKEYNEHWKICDEDCSCNGPTGAITYWMPLPSSPENQDDVYYPGYNGGWEHENRLGYYVGVENITHWTIFPGSPE